MSISRSPPSRKSARLSAPDGVAAYHTTIGAPRREASGMAPSGADRLSVDACSERSAPASRRDLAIAVHEHAPRLAAYCRMACTSRCPNGPVEVPATLPTHIWPRTASRVVVRTVQARCRRVSVPAAPPHTSLPDAVGKMPSGSVTNPRPSIDT
jgi:hypothetical protein